MKKKSIVILCAGFVSLTILFIALKSYKNYPIKKSQISEVAERDQVIFRNDREILKNSDSTTTQIQSALFRLSKIGDNLALEEGLNRLQQSNEDLVASAARAIGLFNDPRVALALENLLQSSNEKIRIAALIALGELPRSAHSAGGEREKIVDAFVRKKQKTPSETIQAYAALLQLSSTGAGRDWAAKQLLNVARTAPSELQLTAIELLTSLAPQNLGLLDHLRNTLTDKSKPKILVVAIRHLAARKDNYYLQKIESLAFSTSDEVRFSVVQSLHFACPENRQDLLFKWLLKEKSLSVREAILREPSLIGGNEGLALAKAFGQNSGLSEQDHEIIKNVILEMNSRVPPEMCQNQR